MARRTSKLFLDLLKRRERIRYWQAIAAWVAFIYTLAFSAVQIAVFLAYHTNLNFLMTLLFVVVLFYFVISLFQKSGIHKTETFVLTLSTNAVFMLQYFTSTDHAKQYHLVEYSILSYLLYGAIRLDFQGIKVWLLAFFGAVLAGLGDEALQHFIRGRHGSLGDVLLDMKGIAFGLMFASIVEFEKRLLSQGKGRRP